jgi:thioredoxin reductase
VRVDASQQTHIDGVYAAGDICAPHLKSIAIAVGHGSIRGEGNRAKLNATFASG